MPHQGELIVFEGGEFSDRYTIGPFRALCDFSVTRAFEQSGLPEAESLGGTRDERDIMEWLNRNGYIEDVECRRFYLGHLGMREKEDWD